MDSPRHTGEVYGLKPKQRSSLAWPEVLCTPLGSDAPALPRLALHFLSVLVVRGT